MSRIETLPPEQNENSLWMYINKIIRWWNDHNSGARVWDNVNTINLNVTGTSGFLPLTGGTMSGAIDMGSHKITSLTNGSSAQDAAAFGQIPTFTDWASYSPTIAGLGTVTNLSFFWKQMDKTILVKGFLTCGTVAAAAISITLPNSTTFNYSHMPNPGTNSTQLGYGFAFDNAGPTAFTATRVLGVFADHSSTTLAFLSAQGQSGVFVKNNGNAIFNNSDGASVEFSYAI